MSIMVRSCDFSDWITRKYPQIRTYLRTLSNNSNKNILPTSVKCDYLLLPLSEIISSILDKEESTTLKSTNFLDLVEHELDSIIDVLSPSTFVYLTLDSVAPSAILQNIRQTCFDNDDLNSELSSHEHTESKSESKVAKSTFDYNQFLTGTKFTENLSHFLQQWILKQLAKSNSVSGDVSKVQYLFSDHTEAGLGIEKIATFLRHQRMQSNYNTQLRYVMYGCSDGVYRTGCMAHERYFSFLYQDLSFDNGQGYMLVHMNLLRDFLKVDFAFDLTTYTTFQCDVDRVLDDIVLLSLMCKSDVLPYVDSPSPSPSSHHVLALHGSSKTYISHMLSGISQTGVSLHDMMALYQSYLHSSRFSCSSPSYLTYYGNILLVNLEAFLKYILTHQNLLDLFKIDLGLGLYVEEVDNGVVEGETDDLLSDQNEQLETDDLLDSDCVGDSSDSDKTECNMSVPHPANIVNKLCPYPNRTIDSYYSISFPLLVESQTKTNSHLATPICFNNSPSGCNCVDICDCDSDSESDSDDGLGQTLVSNNTLRSTTTLTVATQVCEEWVKGLVWNYKYYYSGVVSWSWYYAHTYSPTLHCLHFYLTQVNSFASDEPLFKFYFDQPLLPLTFLLSVLPLSSMHLLPSVYRSAIKRTPSLKSLIITTDSRNNYTCEKVNSLLVQDQLNSITFTDKKGNKSGNNLKVSNVLSRISTLYTIAPTDCDTLQEVTLDQVNSTLRAKYLTYVEQQGSFYNDDKLHLEVGVRVSQSVDEDESEDQGVRFVVYAHRNPSIPSDLGHIERYLEITRTLDHSEPINLNSDNECESKTNEDSECESESESKSESESESESNSNEDSDISNLLQEIELINRKTSTIIYHSLISTNMNKQGVYVPVMLSSAIVEGYRSLKYLFCINDDRNDKRIKNQLMKIKAFEAEKMQFENEIIELKKLHSDQLKKMTFQLKRSDKLLADKTEECESLIEQLGKYKELYQ